MQPRALALILLRVLAVWVILEALFSLGDLVAYQWAARASANTTGWTSYPPLNSAGIPASQAPQSVDLYLHDVYYVIRGGFPGGLGYTLRIGAGVVLLLISGKLAGWIARNADAHSSQPNPDPGALS